MIRKIISLAFCIGMSACQPPAGEELVQPLGSADTSPTAAIQSAPCPGTDSFAVQVFSVLAAAQKDNFIFSPAGLEAVLRLLQQGARGATEAELAALPMGKPGVRTAMTPTEAAALFISNDLVLKPGVKADEVLKVPFATAPAQSAKLINNWAKKCTRGLISSVISAEDISPATALVAANAIYLKEKWLYPFPANDTQVDDDFTTENGTRVPVAMMCSEAKYPYAEGADWRAVALPYNTEGRSGEPGYFIGILPKNSARDFAANLTPQLYRDICKALADSQKKKTIVHLPRMEANPGTYSLKPALQACGLKNIFTFAADFSGFCRQELYLDDVLQRCYIKANEEGTEAAAVTIGLVKYEAIPPGPQPELIRFDRPFIWIIGDLNTPAAPYFMGIMQKP